VGEPTARFRISEATIRRDRNRSLAVNVFVTVGLVGAVLYFLPWYWPVLGPVLLGIALTAGLNVFQDIRHRKRQRSTEVFVFNDRFVRKCGEKEQSLQWTEIKTVRVREYPDGDVWSLELRPKTGMAVSTGGLEKMSVFADLVKARVPETCAWQTKRMRIDWVRKPMVQVLYGFVILTVVGAVFFALAKLGGRTAIDVLGFAMGFAVGLILLIWRPMTRLDIRLRWMEIILSVFMIALGIVGVVGTLLK
jgi:hypothetical protein